MPHPHYLSWQIEKVCTGCEESKALDDFHSHKQGKFGRRSKCKDCYKLVVKSWKKNNRDKVNKATLKSREKNKEQYRKTYNEWQASNRDKKNAKEALRKAAKINATPKWLNASQKEDIRCIYRLAKKFESLFGIKYHVDHIVPLRGENVCGLHVPWNLQILTSTANMKKSNKVIQD